MFLVEACSTLLLLLLSTGTRSTGRSLVVGRWQAETKRVTTVDGGEEQASDPGGWTPSSCFF